MAAILFPTQSLDTPSIFSEFCNADGRQDGYFGKLHSIFPLKLGAAYHVGTDNEKDV